MATHGPSSVRVPPQSTGKRVATNARTFLKYDTLTGSFAVGDIVSGNASFASGSITANVTDGFISTEGQLILANVSGTFINNEELQVSAVTQAISELSDAALPLIEYDYQNTVIVDPENPTQQQRIDRFGATINTFVDGSPVFGSFGSMSVGEPQIIKDYRFAYTGRDNDFWDNTSGGGSIAREANTGVMLFSTGTADGDLASRTSNFYHPYIPGVGTNMDITLRMGDTGKTNVERRWGYFDDNNGLFFQHDGTTLSFVIRSDTTGSVVETTVTQANWNLDKLDGSDNIGFNLDLSNPNVYWIDFQWLGAGRVRFGVMEPSGARIAAHVFKNANSNIGYPYMATATLPIRIEQTNNGAAASSSELRWACASVKHSTKVLHSGNSFARGTDVVTVATASGEVPVFSYRPKATFNSITNRGIIKTVSNCFTNITNTGGGQVRFKMRIGTDAELTGEAFASAGADSIVETDTSATAITGTSEEIFTIIVAADRTLFVQNLNDAAIHKEEIFLNADGITQPVLIVTAECLTGTNADVVVALNWEELLN